MVIMHVPGLERSGVGELDLGRCVLTVRGRVVRRLAEAVVAVAAGVLVQVPLVVVLGVPERAGLGSRLDLGRDLAVPGLLERLLVARAGLLGRRLLGVAGGVDRGAVGRAD